MSIKKKEVAERDFRQQTKTVNGSEYTSWVVYLGTDKATHKKIRFERSTKDELRKAVREFYAAMDNGLTANVSREFTANGFADYQLARSILDEAGFQSVTFVEAARSYIENHKTFTSVPLYDAYREYIAQYSEVQTVQRSAVENRVGLAVDWLGREKQVASITIDTLKGYLAARFSGAAAKTWNNNLTYLKSFFAWCVRQRYCASNPMEGMKPKAIHYTDPEFVRADAVRSIFDVALSCKDEAKRNQMVWCFALSFFAGARTEEISRLTRGAINLDEGYVRILPKGFQHGVPPRIVYLTDTAKAWMAAYPIKVSGSPDAKLLGDLPLQDSASRFVKSYADRHGIKLDFPHNAGRHSFVTMHVALHGDPRKTEMIVGTSAQMRVKHYQGLATRKEAEEYFGVLPSSTLAAQARA